MTIIATKCKGRDLTPGDLFSTADQAYWSSIERQQSVGERVYIRTDMPADQFLDADEEIYRITINTAAGETINVADADDGQTGGMIGNNYKARGHAAPFRGSPDGEEWYVAADGTTWSIYDVAFRPDK